MSTLKSRLKAIIASLLSVYKTLVSYAPSKLPTTPAQLEAFTMDILTLGKFPDNASFRHAICSQILHLDIRKSRATKQEFIQALNRSITNQIAYGTLQDLKQGMADATPKDVQ